MKGDLDGFVFVTRGEFVPTDPEHDDSAVGSVAIIRCILLHINNIYHYLKAMEGLACDHVMYTLNDFKHYSPWIWKSEKTSFLFLGEMGVLLFRTILKF